MLGSIAGDIIGSRYEASKVEGIDFELFTEESRFTDDTVLSVATSDAILFERPFEDAYREYTHMYPSAGYGGDYIKWAFTEDSKPYGSYGNGSAMRVSPVGFAYDDEETVMEMAKASAECTHNHEQGILGAQATAMCVLWARTGKSKDEIRAMVSERFKYNLERTLDEIRPTYSFKGSCQETVPEAITAFLESSSIEDAIRKAVSLGGDADTLGCITGSIAHAYYGQLPGSILSEIRARLDEPLMGIVTEFCKRCGIPL